MKILKTFAIDKKLIVSIASVFFIINNKNANAQNEIGIAAGISINKLVSSGQQGFKLNSENGKSLNISAVFRLSKTYSILAEPGFVQKNYIKESTVNPDIAEHFYNNYFQLPLSIRFLAFQKPRLSTFFDLGTYVAYWLNSRVKGQVPDLYSAFNLQQVNNEYQTYYHLIPFDRNYTIDNEVENRFEAGITAGIGEKYSFKKSILSIKLFALRAITSVKKSSRISPVSYLNQSINVQLVYSFKLKNHEF